MFCGLIWKIFQNLKEFFRNHKQRCYASNFNFILNIIILISKMYLIGKSTEYFIRLYDYYKFNANAIICHDNNSKNSFAYVEYLVVFFIYFVHIHWYHTIFMFVFSNNLLGVINDYEQFVFISFSQTDWIIVFLSHQIGEKETIFGVLAY